MFYLLAFLMTAAATAILIPPLLRPPADDEDAQKQNIDAAKDRLARLKQRADAGDISAPAFKHYRDDIERQLANDTSPPPTQRPPAKKGLSGSFIALLLLPILSAGLYLHLSHRLPPILSTPPTLTAAADELQKKLTRQPADAKGWRLLAKTFMTLQRYEEAAAAFATARKLQGDSVVGLAANIDALLTAAENNGGQTSDNEEINDLLQKALLLQATHPTFLWLAGRNAKMNGDKTAAINYWRQAELQLKDSPRQEIRALIKAAENER